MIHPLLIHINRDVKQFARNLCYSSLKTFEFTLKPRTNPKSFNKFSESIKYGRLNLADFQNFSESEVTGKNDGLNLADF